MCSSAEKRKFPRVDDSSYVFCQSTGKKSTGAIKGFSRNISSCGIMFETDHSVSPEVILNVEVYKSFKHSKERLMSIPILAKTKWMEQINSHKGSNMYRIGVEFMPIIRDVHESIT